MEFYKVILILSVSCSASAITFPLTSESLPAPSTSAPSNSFDEYFKPEASEPKARQNSENCEKVIKNGMMCLVCSDENTGKSEQCAYISHPPKKYSGQKKPRPEPDIDELTPQKSAKTKKMNKKYKNLRRYDESAESEDSSNYSEDFEGFGDYYPEYTSKSERLSNAESNDCEEVAREDGTICTVCKDEKNGGNSQRCRRAYQPKESVYGYSRSRSFGVPKSEGKKKPKSVEKSQSYRREDNAAEDRNPHGSLRDPQNSRRDTYGYPAEKREVEEEEHSRERGDGNCKEEERDGMICTVCVNPKTNGKSEQCSYSYKPEDELFAYTNSKSYGSPSERKG
ncbi:high mobility group nucleosome-binding domain-containing protein 5-like [Cotesia glomerata]|uniref:Uncharacterized protein n=1 Tax=Cotesia glomerata TaxID=32391 RepID=A0AAV7INY1_COTGL|nr:high mobility group nucleosome-binding domain-containing protein 5-like [Cotesia glomerata]KAH0555353.1 hypothetical protein KQX54_017858 [Cotesia glomerata]